MGVPQITDALGARAESLRQMCNALDDDDDDDDDDAARQTSKSTRFFAPSVVALPHVSVVNYSHYGTM